MNCPKCGLAGPDNQRGCNKCGFIFNPPLKGITIQVPPTILLAFKRHGKKGESLNAFVTRLALYFLEDKVNG